MIASGALSIAYMSSPSIPSDSANEIRNDWTKTEARKLISAPLNDLLYDAQKIHRRYFDANEVQVSTLLSIKTEDVRKTVLTVLRAPIINPMLAPKIDVARSCQQGGSPPSKRLWRYPICMGVAWREPKDHDLDNVCDMISEVKALGLESCATLGMLKDGQAERLKEAGPDFYNHNLDTSEEYYEKIISTRNFEDRLATLARVRQAGINVCCGGILGMGENRHDRADMLQVLARLPEHPESIPLNMLVPIPGTPLAETDPLDPLELVRAVATACIMMPKSMVRLSAGRTGVRSI